MNKAELIDELTKKMGSDRRQATAAVENVVDTIVRAVHKGDSVTITGFGVFEQRRRAARVARNPRTGGGPSSKRCRTGGHRREDGKETGRKEGGQESAREEGREEGCRQEGRQ